MHADLSVLQTVCKVVGCWVVTKGHFQFFGHHVFIVGDMNNELPKQTILSVKFSELLQYNGMTQLLLTATRITIDSTTLVNQVLHNLFFDNPDYGIFDAGSVENSAVFVKLFFTCKKYDDTGTTYAVFVQDKFIWRNFQSNWKCPISTMNLMGTLKCVYKPYQTFLNYEVKWNIEERKNLKHLSLIIN